MTSCIILKFNIVTSLIVFIKSISRDSTQLYQMEKTFMKLANQSTHIARQALYGLRYLAKLISISSVHFFYTVQLLIWVAIMLVYKPRYFKEDVLKSLKNNFR